MFRIHPIASAVACACAFVSSSTTFAAPEAQLDAVVVTATRFEQADPRVPAHVSVITREDIRRSPALNLPDVLRSQANVDVRPLSGALGIDSVVDLRGFGDAANSNTLVLLDGQRLNPVDLGSLTWSAIPLESIQRIEIVRGSGAVLYGDRAVGGVINIITDKSGKPQASASATAGEYGYRQLTGHLAGGTDTVTFNVYANAADANGFRRNNQADQAALSGRVAARPSAALGLSLDYAAHRDSNGLPGSIFRAQYEADPSAARTPFDTQRRDGYRLRPGLAWDIRDRLRLESEVSIDRGRLRTDARSASFIENRDRDTDAFSTRLRWNHGIGSAPSETVAGVDWFDGRVEAQSQSAFSGANVQTASQEGRALYAQNITRIAAPLHLTMGVRQQRVRQEATDRSADLRGEATRSRSAYDIGLSADLAPALRAYAKGGTVFRFPATDELFGFNPVTFQPVFRGDLRPQHGRNHEIGMSWTEEPLRIRFALFRLDLTDEIGFNSTTFTNDNLPRTRRNGVEIEGDARLGSSLRATFAYARTSARLREGPDSGNRIPLVPGYKASAGLIWEAGSWGTYSGALNVVGRRIFSGDFANIRGELPAYAVLDLKASWQIRPWTISLRVLNALDKRYAPFAGFSTFFNDSFYFPADPRTAYVTARYDFL